MKHTKKICLLAGTALIGCALLFGCGSNREQTPTTSVTIPTAGETKLPSEYTWEEYLAMTEEEKLEFQKKFGSSEAFEAWMNAAQWEQEKLKYPWNTPGAKQPEEYTWEEFEALSGEYQMAFQSAMGPDAFTAWMTQSQTELVEYPWDEPGAKQPEEYTWEEFEALSGEEQIAFQNAMGEEAFAAWMDQSQEEPAQYPWDVPGAKQPEEYTWEEFLALSGEEQMAFQSVMGEEAFAAWMEQPQEEPAQYPWDEPGAKQPEDYTWDDFLALSGENQIAFQMHLGQEAFEAWLAQVNP